MLGGKIKHVYLKMSIFVVKADDRIEGLIKKLNLYYSDLVHRVSKDDISFAKRRLILFIDFS